MNDTPDYIFRKHTLNGKTCFDIEQENLIYSDMISHHGLQCNHKGNSKEFNDIEQLCALIVILLKQIDKLNTRI